MLTTPELQAIVGRVTYKAGWIIEVYDGHFEGQHLVVAAQVIDAYDPTHLVTLDVHSMLPPMRDEQQFMDHLAWRLGRIEIHEMREWLKLDGVPPFDPHAEHADRDE